MPRSEKPCGVSRDLRTFICKPRASTWGTQPSPHLDLHTANSRHLLTRFSASELPHLIHLSIGHVDAMTPFVRFVERCPLLESITMRSLQLPEFIDVPPRSLPLLHTLAAASYLVRSLVPNRCVHTVRVVGWRSTPASLDDLLSVCTDISRSTVPVHTLTLAPSTPTIEFLRRLLLLFPDLRELCLAIINPRYIGLAQAFACLPAEELSDDEAEDVPIHHVENIIGWICDGLLDLLPNIESFRLEPQRQDKLPLGQQHNTLAALNGRYLLLREVQVGQYDVIWRREGAGEEVWKAEGQSAVRILRRTNYECAIST
ncbi:hypothetical protein MSAN_02094700 [Mycena sanguinolenta]|uniref:F-box domain-containing protein n=1 Tax=Mycena sanguinolenta TaxID=230812 RepID=A0A8H6XIF6_9AGAR|nr:hypothetical protein MSAN_02094700 [Mycena sanguinolenta]